jgi:hypothetical protein
MVGKIGQLIYTPDKWSKEEGIGLCVFEPSEFVLSGKQLKVVDTSQRYIYYTGDARGVLLLKYNTKVYKINSYGIECKIER